MSPENPSLRTIAAVDSAVLRAFSKDVLIEGRTRLVDCFELGAQVYVAKPGLLRIVELDDEWYDDIRDPQAVIAALRATTPAPADMFTFWQRLPDLVPRYHHPMQWDEIAALRVTSYEHWWTRQIRPRIRTLIRKSEKQGVEVREVPFDDEVVSGLTALFNEAPIRQGRPFWHYGKDFATVKEQFSRCLFRETVLGAYFRGELIGLAMIGNAGRFAVIGQFLSSLKHRDKPTNNALIAKSVQLCEREGLSHLVYLHWSDSSLAEFKRRCGFEPTKVPRYFVPLTMRGRLALKLGLHRGWKHAIPPRIKTTLKRWRATWYGAPGDSAEHA